MGDWQSLRCTICLTNWPHNPTNYDPCPECGSDVRGSSMEPLDDQEAMSRKSHAEFEKFCAKRDALRQREIDRLEKSLTASTVDGPISQTGLPKPRPRPRY